MTVRIRLRRGTASGWTSANPILAAGELGYETDTGKAKVGDGSTAWTSLSYLVQWSTITGRPTVIASGSTQSEARTAIGLGSVDDTADAAKNVLSATKLTTARTINGVSFDGTANVTVADSTKVPTTRTVNGKALSADVTLTQDDVASGTTNKVYTATEQTKLAGIATGATANSTEATGATGGTLALRDSNANLTADNFINVVDSTATAAGTTTLTIASGGVQVFTGTTTQTVRLPTTSVVAGMSWVIVNQSSGAVTVQSSGANTVATVAAGNTSVFYSTANTPTTASHWVEMDTVSGTQTLTNKTLTNPTINNYTEGTVAITVSGSPPSGTISLASGTVQTITLTASVATTLTMPTAVAGKSFVVLCKQAVTTGGGTVTFTGVKWPNGGTAPTITATAAKMDIFSFVSDGTNWYGSAAQNYTP